MTKPFVSVLIDTYDHEKYIEQCVLSAIEQDFPAADYEIVVVDDGSTDRTPEIVGKFAPRVRLLSKKNGGQASAFNAAFPQLRGEIVAFLDGDDWFAPGKLSAVVSALENNPQAAAASHGYYEFHDQTKEIKVRVPRGKEFLSLSDAEAARKAAGLWPFLIIGALTVRRRVVDQVAPISEALVFCADGPIAWAAMAMGTVLLKEALCYYRHHDSNLHAVDRTKTEREYKRVEMNERIFGEIEPMLIRMGVQREAILESLYPQWVLVSRPRLHQFGGRRLETMHTEMRAFRAEYKNPTLAYRLFKYSVIAAGAFLLSPRQFYTVWNWYGQQNLPRFPQPFRKSTRGQCPLGGT